MEHVKSQIKQGFLERWGIFEIKKYHQKLSDQQKEQNILHLFEYTKPIIFRAVLYSFLAGFITTVFIVYTESLFPENVKLYSKEFYTKWTVVGISLLFWSLVEFYILYKIGLESAYRIVAYSGLYRDEEKNSITDIPTLLARVSLEIPDPETKILGVDPLKIVNKKVLLIRSIVYKLKVILSNFLIKLIIRKLLARNSFRIYVDFIAAPITGFWDGIVTYWILKELRIRILSRYLAENIISQLDNNIDKMSKNTLIYCFQSIGNSIVHAQRFHPALEHLLVYFYNKLNINIEEHVMDEWSIFKDCIENAPIEETHVPLQLLKIAFAFDGKLSGIEKNRLKEIFIHDFEDVKNYVQTLSDSIYNGDVKKAIELCSIDFNHNIT